MIKIALIISVVFLLNCKSFAQGAIYNLKTDISYYSDSLKENNEYIKERCLLDLYYPTNSSDFATIIWFHGGGLRAGNKYIPEELKNKGLAVVAVNYRLFPKVKAPKYIEDAAAATAWTFKNISKFGGSSSKIFISGHSAGGYLTSMIGLDIAYLKNFGVNANDIAGLIPFSGHAITHFTVREERKIPGTQAIIDSLAPIFHVRADAPPI